MTNAYRPGMNFWKHISDESRAAGSERLARIVQENLDELVGKFYDSFLAHEEGKAFLNHSVVTNRLHKSLRNWLIELVSVDPMGDMTEFDARQVKVGEVHARLKIPNHLVMEGMTLLKSEIAIKIAELDIDRRSIAEAIILLDELIDYAMRHMSAAFLSDTSRRIQTDEAFRLFSLGQDVHLERETQRAALMEWSQQVLFNLFSNDCSEVTKLANSPFGLWVRHRGAILFQGAPQLDAIQNLMHAIDDDVLSKVSDDRTAGVAALQVRIEEIKYHLNDLFNAASNVENGRDPLTRTLNRRFLPSVLGREVGLAKRANQPLSVLMIDIDHFKTINDVHGHQAGDSVLSHVAEILLNTVRPSDFVFRYGGEEFLIVLVEATEEQAFVIGERIRARVEEKAATAIDRPAIPVTISVGVAAFEGHPDYQYLINAADNALYVAKNGGRNRVAAA
jgi:diguanylate cyclase